MNMQRNNAKGNRLPDPGKRYAAQSQPDGIYAPGDPIPVPDVIEEDSESVWKLWCQTREDHGDGYADTQPMGL